MSCPYHAGLTALVASAALALGLAPSGAAADDGQRSDPSAAGTDRGAIQDVMFLTDVRPIFIRLRLDAGGRPFRASWLDAVKAIHSYLDRDGDGTLTREDTRVANAVVVDVEVDATAYYRRHGTVFETFNKQAGRRFGIVRATTVAAPAK